MMWKPMRGITLYWGAIYDITSEEVVAILPTSVAKGRGVVDDGVKVSFDFPQNLGFPRKIIRKGHVGKD
jgi:hypothetical protein